MKKTIQVADKKGRVTLPGFASETVAIERISDEEYRVRKVLFIEDEMPIELSERDARKLLEIIENPPEPNAALRRAFQRYKEQFKDK